jgi:hypothetical protein
VTVINGPDTFFAGIYGDYAYGGRDSHINSQKQTGMHLTAGTKFNRDNPETQEGP